MEDVKRTVDAESTECVAQESSGRRYNRRSSILKPQKPRNPLQDLDFNPTLTDETTVTRKSRRVSFAAGSQVKEFHEVRTEVSSVTVWGPTYEQTIINSGSDSSHHVDFTIQGDSSNISNFDALVTGRIHLPQHNHCDDSEIFPVDPENNHQRTQLRHNTGRQENYHNSIGNNAAFEDRPLDLTLGTAKPAASRQSLRGANQNGFEASRFEAQNINGSIHHSMKTTFYGGDDEMDLSLSMEGENNGGLFNMTGFVDIHDLSSSNEVFGMSGGEAGGQELQNAHFTRPQSQANHTGLQANESHHPDTAGKLHQNGSSKPFSYVACENPTQQDTTVFGSNMDFTEPVNQRTLFPLLSNYQAEADKTLYVENMDFTEVVTRNTTSYCEGDENMDIGFHKDNILSTRQNQQNNTAKNGQHREFDQFNKTVFGDEMEITKPVNAAIIERETAQFNKTVFGDEMDITKPVNAAIIERETAKFNKTVFADEMDITKPVNAAIIERETAQFNKTVFGDEMEITKPVNAAIIERETAQFNKTVFADEMDITKPVNAAIIERETAQFNKTVFGDEMDITKPVNAAIIVRETAQFNKTVFGDEMDITKPVNAAIIERDTAKFNKTVFADEMDITKPVNAAIIERDTAKFNKTVFADEMDITKPVNAVIIERETTQFNKTVFADEMDITKPVNAAIIERDTAKFNKTVFADEMDITKPVNAAIIERETTQFNKTVFADEMDITKPVNAAIIERDTAKFNKTVFADEMDITKPVSSAIIERETAQFNKTVFADEMDITKPVSSAIIERETAKFNKTVFADEMDITKPVNAAIIEHENASGKLIGNSSKTSRDASSFSGSGNSRYADFPELVSAQDGRPANTLHFSTHSISKINSSSSLSLSRMMNLNESVAIDKCVGELEILKTPLEETKDVTDAIDKSNVNSKTFVNHDSTQVAVEAAISEQDACQSSLQVKNIVQEKDKLTMDASDSSIQREDSCLGQDQMNASTRSPLSCTNLKFLSQPLQETLNTLRVKPIPEISSYATCEVDVGFTDTVSPKLSLGSLDSSIFDATTSEGIDNLCLFEEVESNGFDNEVQLLEMKRPRQSGTLVADIDLCSPPKQICLRGNDGEVILAESNYNFEDCEIKKISSTDSPLNLEELDDSLVDGASFIMSNQEKLVEKIAESHCQENEKNSLLDLTNEEVQKCESDKMVPIIAPIEQEPETIERMIRKLAKSSNEWEILELEESMWTFSFFFKTLDLVLKLGSGCGDGDQEVISINFISHRTEKSSELCHFSHKWLVNAFPVEEMRSKCRSLSDVVALLDLISEESAKITLFVDDFLCIRNSYGMKLKNDQQTAHVVITSHPLFSSFIVTFDLQQSWKSFTPNDVTVVHLVGKTIRTDVIKSLAKGVPPGPHCLKKLFLDITKYVENLERVRPPGPLRFS